MQMKDQAWKNILKMAEEKPKPSNAEKIFTFGTLTKLGMFAGAVISGFSTGGLSAIAQGAAWGAVSGKVGDIAANRCKTPRR